MVNKQSGLVGYMIKAAQDAALEWGTICDHWSLEMQCYATYSGGAGGLTGIVSYCVDLQQHPVKYMSNSSLPSNTCDSISLSQTINRDREYRQSNGEYSDI